VKDDSTKTTTKEQSSEFTTFVRRVGIGAFDSLASKWGTGAQSLTQQDESPNPIQKLAAAWQGTSQGDKEKFFDQLIFAAQTVAAATPAVIGMVKLSKTRTASKAKAKVKRTGEAAKSSAMNVADSMGLTSSDDQKKSKKGKKVKKSKKDKKDKKSRKKNTN